MNELVSIIIPELNEEEHIVKQIKSICRQNYLKIEIIIVDGGSKDKTIPLINACRPICENRGYDLILLHEKDFGELRSPANARNIGIDYAKGNYLLLLDADIFFIESDSVTKLVNCLNKHKFATVNIKYIIDTRLEHHLVLSYGGHSVCQSFYRRDIFDNVRFDTDLGLGEDAKLHRMIKWKDYPCKTTLGRHFAHTWKEFKIQAEWYGRTSLRFYKVLKEMGENIKPYHRFLRGFFHNFLRSISPLIWIIFLAFPPWGILFSMGYLIVFILKYIVLWRKLGVNTFERLLYLFLIEWAQSVFSCKAELQLLLWQKSKIGH